MLRVSLRQNRVSLVPRSSQVCQACHLLHRCVVCHRLWHEQVLHPMVSRPARQSHAAVIAVGRHSKWQDDWEMPRGRRGSAGGAQLQVSAGLLCTCKYLDILLENFLFSIFFLFLFLMTLFYLYFYYYFFFYWIYMDLV